MPYEHVPGRGDEQPVEELGKRAFAAAVHARERDELSPLRGKGNIAERADGLSLSDSVRITDTDEFYLRHNVGL